VVLDVPAAVELGDLVHLAERLVELDLANLIVLVIPGYMDGGVNASAALSTSKQPFDDKSPNANAWIQNAFAAQGQCCGGP